MKIHESKTTTSGKIPILSIWHGHGMDIYQYDMEITNRYGMDMEWTFINIRKPQQNVCETSTPLPPVEIWDGSFLFLQKLT